MVFPLLELVFDEDAKTKPIQAELDHGPKLDLNLLDANQEVLIEPDGEPEQDVLVAIDAEEAERFACELVFPKGELEDEADDVRHDQEDPKYNHNSYP